MHTTTVEYTHDRWDNAPGTQELFHCHHNGDYSGDVKIAMSPTRVEQGMPFEGHPDYMMVDIPFKVFKELVADYLRSQLIQNYENMGTDSILGRVLL